MYIQPPPEESWKNIQQEIQTKMLRDLRIMCIDTSIMLQTSFNIFEENTRGSLKSINSIALN